MLGQKIVLGGGSTDDMVCNERKAEKPDLVMDGV
jgi:hypothetical protein